MKPPEPSADAADPSQPDQSLPASGTGPATGERGPSRPLLAEQSREDTDAAWGEYPERGDDRLTRDRPPHWDDV